MPILRLLGQILLCSALYVGFRWRTFENEQQAELSIPTSPTAAAPAHFTRRIVAVGDLHGDMPNALKVLQMADVVDHEGNWTGNVDYFVQTGDIIDR